MISQDFEDPTYYSECYPDGQPIPVPEFQSRCGQTGWIPDIDILCVSQRLTLRNCDAYKLLCDRLYITESAVERRALSLMPVPGVRRPVFRSIGPDQLSEIEGIVLAKSQVAPKPSSVLLKQIRRGQDRNLHGSLVVPRDRHGDKVGRVIPTRSIVVTNRNHFSAAADVKTPKPDLPLRAPVVSERKDNSRPRPPPMAMPYLGPRGFDYEADEKWSWWQRNNPRGDPAERVRLLNGDDGVP